MSALDNRPCCSNHDPQRPLGPQANTIQAAVKKELLEPGEEGDDGNEEEEDDDEGGEGEWLGRSTKEALKTTSKYMKVQTTVDTCS